MGENNDMSLRDAVAAVASSVEKGALPGAVVLISGPNRADAQEVIGANSIAGNPMRLDTLFRIASLTKPIVSAAALRLIEAGKLQLQDPIAQTLPELASLKVLRTLGPRSDRIESAARPLTIFDLLTHTSGFAYPITAEGVSARLLGEFNTEFLPGCSEKDWLRRLAEVPLMHQPGEAYTYGFSTDVLGLILSRTTGRSLGEYLNDALFAPLNMCDTTFLVKPENWSKLAHAYTTEPDGRLTSIPAALDCQHALETGFESGGAGLVSTAADVLRFARFLLAGLDTSGRPLLSEHSIKMMTSNHLTAEQRQRPAFGAADYWREQGFGLGLSVLDRPSGNRANSAGRYGWAGIYGTWWSNAPSHRLCAIVMTQVMTGNAPPSHEVQFEANFDKALS
ncbi:serine hydrolase domain-containing protein [Allomesorhizobium camelthorni]|uniref:Beta-lactamase family protein n=1 Tax=Allomesorhizobium camelthorni TaxID=475069 RepID=A0A6G4WNR3_9HYPH|nr:serine hydrolase domain-containing protein [Mesorhizobium camelthorni]NGO55833.1 beta-lactamase family protein [Mesorhizobium camelthorni]